MPNPLQNQFEVQSQKSEVILLIDKQFDKKTKSTQ